jgi:exo-1,4-beta-D-glucosaminidase
MKPIASYFGTKVGTRTEHVAFDYQQAAVYVINHSLTRDGPRTVSVDLIDLQGNYLWHETLQTATVPNASKKVATVAGIDQIRTMALLKLVMTDDADSVLSRNVYWLSRQRDMLAWDNSTWYYTPVSEYANFQSLEGLSSASVTVTVATDGVAPDLTAQVILENKSEIPAFFLRLNVMDRGRRGYFPNLLV